MFGHPRLAPTSQVWHTAASKYLRHCTICAKEGDERCTTASPAQTSRCQDAGTTASAHKSCRQPAGWTFPDESRTRQIQSVITVLTLRQRQPLWLFNFQSVIQGGDAQLVGYETQLAPVWRSVGEQQYILRRRFFQRAARAKHRLHNACCGQSTARLRCCHVLDQREGPLFHAWAGMLRSGGQGS